MEWPKKISRKAESVEAAQASGTDPVSLKEDEDKVEVVAGSNEEHKQIKIPKPIEKEDKTKEGIKGINKLVLDRRNSTGFRKSLMSKMNKMLKKKMDELVEKARNIDAEEVKEKVLMKFN